MDSNSYLELSLKLQMVPLSLYPVKSLILLMVQGCLRAKLWTPLTVPDFCPQVSCDLFSGRTHAHPVLSLHRLFFVRSTYFDTKIHSTTTDFVRLWRFTRIDLKFKICTGFASFEFQNKLCKSDKISLHILGSLGTKCVDLTKNNLEMTLI